jgi:hypothetical protein
MGKIKKILLKELCPWTVRENSFEAGVSGTGGSLNYSAPYGTPGGGDVTQNSGNFKTVNSHPGGAGHMGDNEDSASIRRDRKSSSGAPIHPGATSDAGDFENPNYAQKPNHMISMDKKDDNDSIPNPERANSPNSDLGGEPSAAAKFDQTKSETPLNPDQNYDSDVNKIFKKKQTPTPDEIMCGIQYELGKMTKKDKTIAKRMVLQNLKTNPHYYSELDMLNMNDKKMKVDESQVSKTKNVLDQMIAERQARITPPPPYLDEIFKGLYNKRRGVSNIKSEKE